MLGLIDYKPEGLGNIRILQVQPASDLSYGLPGYRSFLYLLKAPEGVSLPAQLL